MIKQLSQSAKHWYTTGHTVSLLLGKHHYKVFYKTNIFCQEKPFLVCLHGFPTTSYDFEPIWQQLCERFNIVAPDLIGLGMSAKPRWHHSGNKLTVSLQADMIEVLCSQLNITTAHLLAHDLGDTIAQELLARQLEKSSALAWKSAVFLNGGMFPESHQPLMVQKLLLSRFAPVLSRIMNKQALHKSFHNIFSPATPPSTTFINDSWQLLTYSNKLNNDVNNGKRMVPLLLNYMNERKKFRERWVTPLVKLSIPKRMINGMDDPISGSHLAQRYAEIVPKSDVVYLENAGHYPHIETPDRVAQALEIFYQNK